VSAAGAEGLRPRSQATTPAPPSPCGASAESPVAEAGVTGLAIVAEGDGGAASRTSSSPHSPSPAAATTAASVDEPGAVASYSPTTKQRPLTSSHQAAEMLGGSVVVAAADEVAEIPLPGLESGSAGHGQTLPCEDASRAMSSLAEIGEVSNHRRQLERPQTVPCEDAIRTIHSLADAGEVSNHKRQLERPQTVPCEDASRVISSLADMGEASNHRRQLDANASMLDSERRRGGHSSVVARGPPRLSGCKERAAPRMFDPAESSARQQVLGDAGASSPNWHAASGLVPNACNGNGGKIDALPWESKVAAEYAAEPRRAALADEFDEEVSDTGCFSAAEAGAASTPVHSRRRCTEQHRRAPSGPLPWSSEEASLLRRTVKRVIKRGTRDKEALWAEVSRELGSGRGPRECKNKYASDYRAHKAPGADLASERRRRRSEGQVCDSLEVEVAAAHCLHSSPRSST